MPRGGRRWPWFSIKTIKSRILEERGVYPWTFEAVTLLRFLGANGRDAPSAPLSFHLDTAAFISVIPAEWVRNKGLRRFIGELSRPVWFTTAAVEGHGRLARAVLVQFPMDPAGRYTFDFLVSANLDGRGYGLISLRDVVRNFEIVTRGAWATDADGTPLSTPNLTLIPRTS
jgi:hypothetical protein